MIKDIRFAQSVASAASMIGPNAVFLGGGTEINRLGSSVSADTLVSFKADDPVISLKGDKVILPLGTTFQMVAESDLVPDYLRVAALFMGSLQKRSMATIAGNLYLHRDDSYIAPCLMASGAEVLLDDGTVASAADYVGSFDGHRQRIIVEIRVGATEAVAQKRIAVTKESHAVLTGAVCGKKGAVAIKGFGVASVDLGAIGCEDCVQKAMDKAGLRFVDDIFGSSEYKRYLCRTVLFDLYKEARR